ncbi:MAG TPA: cyclic nucleotide-binding domain-containing protein [Gammaproteobacteria bacterium]
MTSCRVCDLQPVCLPWELAPADRRDLDEIIDHPAPIRAGEHLFRFGDGLDAIYAVRSGAFKSYRVSVVGNEIVMGFSLPGEMAGLDGVYYRTHDSNAIALVDSEVCLLPYSALAGLMGRSEDLRNQIFGHVSRHIGINTAQVRHSSGEERFAGFLVDLASRAEAAGSPVDELNLPMSQADIASYLGMTEDEVARVCQGFIARELLRVEDARISLLDAGSLKHLARRVLMQGREA